MLGHWARGFILAGLISGLCAPVWANAMSAAGESRSVASFDGMQLAQTDLSLEQFVHEPIGTAIPEPVAMPEVIPVVPPTSMALLLPTQSEALAQVSHAVQAGFMAAWQHEPDNITVKLVETGDTPQDILEAYQQAAAGYDMVIGPLTRSGVTAIVQNHVVVKPTIALAQSDAGEAGLSSNLLEMGLSVEDEARQIAQLNGKGRRVMQALAISTGVSWQRRAATAFVDAWRDLGLKAEVVELPMNGGFIDGAGLQELRSRIQTARPALLFVALDAAQTVQLRLAIGGETTMYGISQLNPHARTEWASAVPLPDLEGVRLLDMPWQLQDDHAAVMTYPPLPLDPEHHRSTDIERLYALGIDAYRVARNIVLHQKDFTLDGVTGDLSVHFGDGTPRFERVLQPAVYHEGVVRALNTQ